MKKKKRRGFFLPIVLMLLLMLAAAGCGKVGENAAAVEGEIEQAKVKTAVEARDTEEYRGSPDRAQIQTDAAFFGSTIDLQGAYDGKGSSGKDKGIKNKGTKDKGAKEKEANAYAAENSEPSIDEDGTYTSKDDVALYLHIYGDLPDNFITKKEARQLGWSGGSLEKYAPGMCIGGDRYSNFEGILPDDSKYWECDIDTLGKKSRGAKRIVYSDDGFIYYTGNHYGSFELMYAP